MYLYDGGKINIFLSCCVRICVKMTKHGIKDVLQAVWILFVFQVSLTENMEQFIVLQIYKMCT